MDVLLMLIQHNISAITVLNHRNHTTNGVTKKSGGLLGTPESV